MTRRLSGNLAVFVVAFLARAMYLLEMRTSTLFSVLYGDAQRFDSWARQIAAGDWFGDEVFYFAPLYPYTMGAAYRLFGADPEVVRWVQALLGSVACGLVAATVRRLFSPSAGLIAGLLLALYPPAIFFDGLIQKASLGTFLTTLLLWLVLSPGRSLRLPLAGGGCFGLLALTRENALVLLPVVVAWLALRPERRSWRSGLTAATVFVLGATLVLAPVGWRNHMLGGRFLPTTAQFGPNFYIGNHSGASGFYSPLPGGQGGIRNEREDAKAVAEAARMPSQRRLTPAEVSDWWFERALADIEASPADWAALMVRKWMLVWQARELIDTEGIELYRDRSRILATLGTVFHFGWLLPLAAAGGWLTRRHWQRLWPLYAVILVLAASVALFFVTARYRYSMVPALTMLAAGGLVELAWLFRHRHQQGEPPLAETLFGTLVANLRISLSIGLGAGLAALGGLAVAYWPFALEEDPRAITLYNLGLSLAAEERLEEAHFELDRALEHKPDSPLVLAARGGVRRRQQRLGPAIEDFEHALALDPGQTDARSGLGRILVELGLPRLATPHFERIVELSPHNPDALVNLGNVRRLEGRLDEATELYRLALRLRPESFEAAMSLALALSGQGRAEAALRVFRRAQAIQPENPTPTEEIRKLEETAAAVPTRH